MAAASAASSRSCRTSHWVMACEGRLFAHLPPHTLLILFLMGRCKLSKKDLPAQLFVRRDKSLH